MGLYYYFFLYTAYSLTPPFVVLILQLISDCVVPPIAIVPFWFGLINHRQPLSSGTLPHNVVLLLILPHSPTILMAHYSP